MDPKTALDADNAAGRLTFTARRLGYLALWFAIAFGVMLALAAAAEQ